MATTSFDPVLRLTCTRAADRWSGARRRQGLLISESDMQLLHALSERDITVSLDCPGLKTFTANVKNLLRRAQRVPGKNVWYVATSVTGPLRQAAPRRHIPSAR